MSNKNHFFYILYFIYFLNSCTLNIDNKMPLSTHVPIINSNSIASEQLKGTIWKKIENNTAHNVFLFINDTEPKYAIEILKESKDLDRFPEEHEYSYFENQQNIGSLTPNKVVIYSISEEPYNYIGFSLTTPHTLTTATASGSQAIPSIVVALQKNQGTHWKLHI